MGVINPTGICPSNIANRPTRSYHHQCIARSKLGDANGHCEPSVCHLQNLRLEEQYRGGNFVCSDQDANYFVESVLPWEISPAFFQNDVLTKYRFDTANYCLEPQGLTYRDEWDLKMYDFSKTGLVYTYIRYLQPLPYAEQLHWQSFNVWPDGADICPSGRVRPLRPPLFGDISAHNGAGRWQ